MAVAEAYLGAAVVVRGGEWLICGGSASGGL